MITPDLTPTQRQCIERSRAFRASIAARAVAQKPAAERSFSVKGAYVPAPRRVLEAPRRPLPAAPPAAPLITTERKYPTIREIQDAVCARYKVGLHNLRSARRTGDLILPRHIGYYLSKELTPHSLPEIGRRFGNRDHTTILYGVRKIGRLIQTDAGLAQDVAGLIELLAPEDQPEITPSVLAEDQNMKRKFFANIYKPLVGASGHVYASREMADQMAGSDRLACVEFEADIPASEGTDAASSDEQH